MKKLYVLGMTLLFLLSCQEDEPMWFDDQYVFLEQHLTEYSEFVKGDYCPHVCIDFPTYVFEPNKKTIDCYFDFDMTESTKMALGTGMSASGVASSGAGTGLSEVQNLPHEQYDLTVEQIVEDGTVRFTYKDSSMVLSSGEEWLRISTKLDTLVQYFEDEITFELLEDTSIIKYTYTDRITNWGKLDKEKFVKHSFE